MKKRERKMITVFAIIPNDYELSVQYYSTKEDAERDALNFYRGEASVSEMEQFEDVVDRKGIQTARYGYKVR